VAFARYENDQAIVACIAEVRVEKNTGAVQVNETVASRPLIVAAEAPEIWT